MWNPVCPVFALIALLAQWNPLQKYKFFSVRARFGLNFL